MTKSGGKQFALASPLQILGGGGLTPCPPVIYANAVRPYDVAVMAVLRGRFQSGFKKSSFIMRIAVTTSIGNAVCRPIIER